MIARPMIVVTSRRRTRDVPPRASKRARSHTAGDRVAAGYFNPGTGATNVVSRRGGLYVDDGTRGSRRAFGSMLVFFAQRDHQRDTPGPRRKEIGHRQELHDEGRQEERMEPEQPRFDERGRDVEDFVAASPAEGA